MNQRCKVCGEPAAGFHFGAFTCEGCKSFFGRTYSNLSSVGECKNGGSCVIDKKNRTSCKACRLRKCILVGMSKNGSRYGRRSNWFKIHCLLQEQTDNLENQLQDGSRKSSSPYMPLENTQDAPRKSGSPYLLLENQFQESLRSSTSPCSSPLRNVQDGSRKSLSPDSSTSGISSGNGDCEELGDFKGGFAFDPFRAPEQELPIDLSCKSSSRSSDYRLHGGVYENTSSIVADDETAPLDLTMKI